MAIPLIRTWLANIFYSRKYLFSKVFVSSPPYGGSVDGVFDKRVWMLFAARRNEDGNVHIRAEVSKTVTKNMRVVLFKNPKEKERPKEAPAVSASWLIHTCVFTTPDMLITFFFPVFSFVVIFIIKGRGFPAQRFIIGCLGDFNFLLTGHSFCAYKNYFYKHKTGLTLITD